MLVRISSVPFSNETAMQTTPTDVLPEVIARPGVAETERRFARQPALGLAGLLLVAPGAVLLAVGAGGTEPSVLVLAPLVTLLRQRWRRLVSANVVAIGGALLTYAAARRLGDARTTTVGAVAGSFIAAGLLVGMLVDGSLRLRLPPAQERLATAAAVALGATAAYLALHRYADGLAWSKAEPDEWVAHVGLDAVGVGVILHVAIGRRWPFGLEGPVSDERGAP
jgi:hypothetical protein